jgi:hypothetical protein
MRYLPEQIDSCLCSLDLGARRLRRSGETNHPGMPFFPLVLLTAARQTDPAMMHRRTWAPGTGADAILAR